ncbi:flagellar filament capping protein FliD [Massilia solisilvae]|uniref:Flagellar hook-associated protein 2 n=1 Tax=Massilia solisilvae TaxID=1811225 RepID=A0ABT2BIK0_9BURK|nr:flagellar filament capping protein FliD [Massilia solisilvae]MCS0608333.1 flagellar filament capping protein FliD [Massilia solisilvae]
MTINSPTYDPASTAAALAQKFTAPTQDMLTAQTKDAQATTKALSDLGLAIGAFQTSLSSLTGLNKTLFAQSAVMSDTSLGTATATATAGTGTFSFFVEQIATSTQVAYDNLSNDGLAGGSVAISIGGTPFTVSLAGADTSKDGKMSVAELAAAINKASSNAGRVQAAVVTIGGVPKLTLTSTATGTGHAITLDASGMTASTLKTKLTDPLNFSTTVAGQNAVAYLGDASGPRIEQASNTFTNYDGLSVTFTKAQAAGATPVSVTVSPDSGKTAKNVQDFVDAYNTLKKAIDGLLDTGDAAKKKAPGTFAHDSGIRALRDRLVALMRPTVGASLAAYGIIATKEGTLAVDSTRLSNQLARDPNGLDALIGKATANTSTRSGIAGALQTFLEKWSDSTSGQIKLRSDANDKLQKSLTVRQTALDAQYDAAYQRYLLQFTRLQTLQNTMNSNSSMFDALFGDKSK